jgi:hypothetical protein
MQAGHQTTGISFWEHGSMVAARFRDLMSPEPAMTWRLPDWFSSNADWIHAQLQPDFDLITTYQQWHDLSKPYCRTVDEDGKAHYPDHASVSASIWWNLGGDHKIGTLISQDMLCHQLRPADALAFAANPNALVLLITAMCELHANASMFGGISSDSFKIKYKRLDKCGAIILSQLSKEQS